MSYKIKFTPPSFMEPVKLGNVHKAGGGTNNILYLIVVGDFTKRVYGENNRYYDKERWIVASIGEGGWLVSTTMWHEQLLKEREKIGHVAKFKELQFS